jgi:hypothetical protein
MRLVNISDKELALLIALRKRFRHGEVILVVRDGIPQYIKRAWESDDLTVIEEVSKF